MKIIVLGNQALALVNFWSVLIRRMLTCGHTVVCCVPPDDTQADDTLAASGARLAHYSLDRRGLNPARDARTLYDLTRLFAAEKPDTLFASTIKPVIYGCLAARFTRVPHIYATITGLGYAFEVDNFFKKCVNRLSALLYKLSLRGAEGVFFQNQDDIAAFADILHNSARVLTARGVGVDIQRFARCPLPPPPPTFLLIARLLEAKGIAEYAHAAHFLKKRYPDVRFQLLGPPEQGSGGIRLNKLREWEGAISYLGQTRDVRPYIAAAHALVLPSWREGTPTAILEGMSMGRAAVVTNAPGCREAVRDGINGILVPVRDAPALANALESLILDPKKLARMGDAGHALALAEFDAEKVASHILADMRLIP
ncbi:MAG: N,N'-diacetylbacillosaminyl-diphospho-undecaprenol alpha-1,3-N-acetylgalactosaminyltransferase [Candidatus Desulfovibrio kirbyi]|uniref:N,N'-diacetylbacillosaminyl-diphospho-undecaprenol alpha-1,3-N-acetylgalactosaminyltransferase n=1 Tax=Candidatus Desulfovibrio kirbyi TaxID=2696086 RepID=A0A6L2R3Z5_9BACT|nr:MAG: N,N'-diacetylbacillosaminyl-diphospho-undecaprenol alpha-1,3-N-acetylgalactosaminyltransferase [Candidatus Desulfovibrio kirbyi]